MNVHLSAEPEGQLIGLCQDIGRTIGRQITAAEVVRTLVRLAAADQRMRSELGRVLADEPGPRYGSSHPPSDRVKAQIELTRARADLQEAARRLTRAHGRGTSQRYRAGIQAEIDQIRTRVKELENEVELVGASHDAT